MVEVTTSGQAPAGATQTSNTDSTNNTSGTASQFPYPNVLSKYTSYSSVITLGVLDDNEIADPNGTYRRNGVKRVIVRSGGTGDQQIKTVYEEQLGITAEYFIDDLEIASTLVPNTATRQTNASIINFVIKEPYSMGLLLETLAESVRDATNGETIAYTSVPFILSVEFIGYDDNGTVQKIPNTTRYFPINLARLDFNVTGAGSEYNITGTPWQDQAFLDEIQRVSSDVQMQGTTVAEFLQLTKDDKPSLTSVLNNKEQEEKDNDNTVQANQYVIAFPTDSAAFTNELLAETEDSQGATQSDQPQSNGTSTVFNSSISLASVKKIVESSGNINEIGKSKLSKNPFDSGTQLLGKPEVQEQETEDGAVIFNRSGITVSPEERSISVRSGKRIQDIIEEIVLMSDYAVGFVDDEPDENGMRNYFRIEANVFNLADEAHKKKTGTSAKIFVYKVIVSKVSQMHFNSPTQNTPNISELKKKIPKEYNYIYSGVNDDIINFDIQFNTAFYQGLRYDVGQLIGDNIYNFDAVSFESQSPQKITEGQNQTEAIPGSNDVNPSSGASSIASGDIEQTSKIALARTFSDILLNSNADLIAADLDIWGDPYFLADSGIGNYSAKKDSLQQTKDKTIDYQNNEPYIILNFITPIDYNQNSAETDYGSMQFPKLDGQPVRQFSGIYRVNIVTHTISGNKFTQRLNLTRLRNQTDEISLSGVYEAGTSQNAFEGIPVFDPGNTGSENIA